MAQDRIVNGKDNARKKALEKRNCGIKKNKFFLASWKIIYYTITESQFSVHIMIFITKLIFRVKMKHSYNADANLNFTFTRNYEGKDNDNYLYNRENFNQSARKCCFRRSRIYCDFSRRLQILSCNEIKYSTNKIP